MERLLWWTSVLSVIVIVMVLTALRRAHIRVEYSVTWLIAGGTLFALSRSSAVMGWIAAALGLSYAPSVLALVAGLIFVVMFFWTCLVISRLRDDNIALAQRIAILEFHLNRLKSGADTAPSVGR